MADSDQPAAVAGSSLIELVAVMDRLRSADGCSWDAEQTHHSLVQYLLEETYEVIDAIETGTTDDLVEELGDLLLQVVFHARIGEEESPAWNVDDVASGITEKLIRRHPHVFGDLTVESTEELEQLWHSQKAAEKQRTSVLDGIPSGLPGLALSAKLLHRAQTGGIDVSTAVSSAGVSELVGDTNGTDLQVQIGDLLLATAYFAGQHGIDPETALREANRRLEEQVRNQEVD